MYAIRSYYAPDGRCRAGPRQGGGARRVITSYSIHYTKLYDYVVRALGGTLFLIGGFVMAYNMYRTVKGDVRVEKPFETAPQSAPAE